MPTAIMLTSANVDQIHDLLDIPKQRLKDDVNYLHEHAEMQAFYIVRDVLWQGIRMNYMIYNHAEFLEDFASVPSGIEFRFVKVTQVKG